jgi:uncharacterized phage protein (predicted DNA packaging)
MVLTVEEVKQFLRLEQDYTEEDILLTALRDTAEEYLKNATGITFDSTNLLAKLFVQVLISDWYENRSFMVEGKTSDKVRFTIQSILTQLRYSYVDVVTT